MPPAFQSTTSPNFLVFPKACELWACEHYHSRSNDYAPNKEFPRDTRGNTFPKHFKRTVKTEVYRMILF